MPVVAWLPVKVAFVIVRVPWLSIAPPSWAVFKLKSGPDVHRAGSIVWLIVSVPFLAAKMAPPSWALLPLELGAEIVPLPEESMAPPSKSAVLSEKVPPVIVKLPLLLTPPPLFVAALPVMSVS